MYNFASTHYAPMKTSHKNWELHGLANLERIHLELAIELAGDALTKAYSDIRLCRPYRKRYQIVQDL